MALLGATAAPAQIDAPPDPTTISLPDMTPTRDRGVIADGWKHFYFHRAGVSYAEAYADFRDCYRFLPVRDALYGYVPGFRLWTRRNAVGPYQPPPNNYGLVGGVILAMIAGPLDRRDRQSRMRRCMEPRGYVRYPLREEIWRQLIDNYSPRSIAMQALAASGPAPDLPPVTR
jgi:hypothetical protein